MWSPLLHSASMVEKTAAMPAAGYQLIGSDISYQLTARRASVPSPSSTDAAHRQLIQLYYPSCKRRPPLCPQVPPGACRDS